MNTIHHITSLGFALLLLALLAPAVLAQAPSDGAALPEGLPAAPGTAQAGIEATGDTAEVRALTQWAKEHQHSHPHQARQAVERALTLARSLNDYRGVAKNFMILGNLATDLDQKEAYFTEAQEVFEQIGDEYGVLQSRLNIGSVLQRKGKLKQTLAIYSDVLRGFERLDKAESQVIVLNNIGHIHLTQSNLEEALVYYEQAISLAETIDDPFTFTAVLNGYGATLAKHGSYERAEMVLRRVLTISEEHGYSRYRAHASNNLGFVFNRRSSHEQALPFLFTAERLSNELGNADLLIAVYDELGKAYMGLNQYDRALHYTSKSLALAQETESISRQMEAHQTLSRVYEAAGDDGQALAHHRRYATVRDSVFTAERAEIIAQMETRYETEEKQRDIERLEQENRIQALRQTFLLAGVGGLLLILGVLFYRYRLKQKANRLLEELDTAKSRFFANISHEFRTPLTVILGGSQDILSGHLGNVSGKISAQLQAMLRNSHQLQRLIDEVLDLNRLEAGKLELNPAPGDLVRSLRRMVRADAPLAERNDIELTFEHDVEHCPRVYDQEKLEKIVGNLLSNALKFTPEGGSVRVELRCNDRVEIAVSDTGPGIPEEAQAKVFERFAQVENGSQHGGLSAVPGTAQAGTGIGLALAKELAELHGGMITLESEPGEGSTFTVRFPLETVSLDDVASTGRSTLQEGKPVPEQQFEIGGDGAATSQKHETESDRTTVLVIEDNDDLRAFVRRSLEETYRVFEAADGETGLQQARTELPDLIVSDVMLPGIDGYEVAQRLKTEPATECIPVVMLTARTAEEDQAEGYGSGAEVYITKPFSPEILHAVITRLLEERLRLRRRLREETGEAEEQEQKNGYPTLRDRARATVLENLYDEDFGVEELASALNMTRFTLYHRFKSEVGASPSTFVKALRMERARELLAGGAGSVSEVAYAVGFNSLVAFSRAYSAHYGTPPSSHLTRSGNTPE